MRKDWKETSHLCSNGRSLLAQNYKKARRVHWSGFSSATPSREVKRTHYADIWLSSIVICSNNMLILMC